jgi:uncharacterized RDD family membrane protein YckC
MLDTPRVVTTPEGIELTLNVAGPVARARAWLIDFFIRMVFYLAIAAAATMFGKMGGGIVMLVLFSLEWAYPVLFEVYWNGATPGKRACHLRVLHDDGTPIRWRASVIRNTIRAVDFLPFMYGFGLVACLLNRDFKRLGDLAAGTVVVYLPTQAVVVVNARPAVENVAAGRNPAVPTMTTAKMTSASDVELTLDEQRAVIDFAERRKRWSDQRATELALHADALLDSRDAMPAAEQLVALADRVTGRARPTAAASAEPKLRVR